MPLQITCYKGEVPIRASAHAIQVPKGPPLFVNATSTFTGAFTIPANCHLIKIQGSGGVTWTSGAIAGIEEFVGTEWRWVQPGDVLTIS
jgi:hypothetical protein